MRIVAGKARGARLKAPKGMMTRPTSGRVKESLFSILGGRVVGRRVLDLFAGTGSLGLEGGDVFASLARLAAEGERFDLVFCDPPYAKGLLGRTLALLDASPLLAGGALVVAESGGDGGDAPPLSRLSLVREARYGHATLVRIFAAREDGA